MRGAIDEDEESERVVAPLVRAGKSAAGEGGTHSRGSKTPVARGGKTPNRRECQMRESREPNHSSS